MNHLAAVIFDMDGVVVDSEPLHERAFREIFAELGYAENHGIDFTLYYGRSDRALWIDFVDKHQLSHGLDALVKLKQTRFLEIVVQAQPIFAGLEPLLEWLAPRYKLGLASGSYHEVISAILTMRNLRRFFPVTVSIQDVAQGKPAPDVFLRTAELLEVEPSRCCVIEDSAAGVEAALAAGMSVIGITNSLPAEKLARATRVVKTYEEIRMALAEHGVAARASLH